MNETDRICIEFLLSATPEMLRKFSNMLEADGREEFKPLIASTRACADDRQAKIDCGGAK